MKRIKKCPDWPLVHVIWRGHWTDPMIVELFSEDGVVSAPTHAHIYNPKVALVSLLEGKFSLPPSVVTISFQDD